MKKEHADNLQCSFCGKNQHEVKKLIAGPKVYICDECIGLCNKIIGEEASREPSPSPTPESARGLMAGLVEREVLLSDLLGAIERHAGSEIPESVRKALTELLGASRALRAEFQSWAGGVEVARRGAEVSAWLRPCLERLGATDQALRALRPAPEGLVPDARLKVIDDAVSQIAEVRGLLVTVAEKEGRENPPVD